jgi:hypothetical protein
MVSCNNEEETGVESIIFSNVNNGKITLDEGEEFIIEYIITCFSITFKICLHILSGY